MSMSDYWNCSQWEFACAVAGYQKANSVDDEPAGMSTERYEELCLQNGYSLDG